jgi:outer membrane protein assembly factor BamB
MVGRVRADGSLAWSDAYDRAANGFPSVGDFDGDGRREAIWIGFHDGVRCYDTADGQRKWTLPLGADRGWTGGDGVSGDINGDGRDEALFVVGPTLYCIGITAEGKNGRLLWTLDLPAPCSTPVVASLEGNQGGKSLAILLSGADGFLYCVR